MAPGGVREPTEWEKGFLLSAKCVDKAVLSGQHLQGCLDICSDSASQAHKSEHMAALLFPRGKRLARRVWLTAVAVALEEGVPEASLPVDIVLGGFQLAWLDPHGSEQQADWPRLAQQLDGAVAACGLRPEVQRSPTQLPGSHWDTSKGK